MDDYGKEMAQGRLDRLQARMSAIWDNMERVEAERGANWRAFSALLRRQFEELEPKEAELLRCMRDCCAA